MVSFEWRKAYPDCRDLVNLIEDNAENYKGIFDTKRAGYLIGIVLGNAIVVLVFSWLWGLLKMQPAVQPNCCIYEIGGFTILALIVYFAYCGINLSEIRKAKKKVTEYQAVWPAILDVVEENRYNFFLPDEPLKAEDIEVRAESSYVNDNLFISGEKVPDSLPRYAEVKPVAKPKPVVHIEPIGIEEQASGLDMEELMKDETVRRLMEIEPEKEEELNNDTEESGDYDKFGRVPTYDEIFAMLREGGD